MFILRTTEMPSLQKLQELERIVVIDSAGPNAPVTAMAGKACLVGEFVQGPFTPQVVSSQGDISTLYMNDPSKFSLISQASYTGTADDQDGTGITFDGNGWAELKGKSFSGLVIQRVDTDMVAADASTAKAFVAFTVTVNAADLTAGATNKDIWIPAGTRFADQAITTATVVVALSQAILIPSGTTCGGSLAMGISFTQNADTGVLTYVTSNPTTGATAFFVKGKTIAIAGLDTPVDTVLPGVNAGTAITGSSATINAAGAASAVFAPAAGGAQPATLADCIAAQYPAAISATLPGKDATNDIIAIWSARNWKGATGKIEAIRAALWTNAIAASATGRGRVACVTAYPAEGSTAAAQLAAYNKYIAIRSTDSVLSTDPNSDRYWSSGPYQQVYSSELGRAITISACGFRAAMKVGLFNDGRSQYLTSVGQPFNAGIQSIVSQEPAFSATPCVEAQFTALKAAGIAWLTKDRAAGWWFYSGVTGAFATSTYANRVDDNRRSFADEIQDVTLGLAVTYAKLPGTTERQDAFAGDMRAYLDSLVNPGPGIEQRALAYQVKDGAAAGNTQALNARGIFLYEASAQMIGSQKTIVIRSAVGTDVVITQVA